jgi:prophage antirepressor-like protein
MSTALVFQSTTFDIIDRDGHPWIQSRQLATALGYKDESSVRKLYERNAGEFSDTMTATVKLTVGITPVDVRIFSLRGCHLLAMFARTPVAKAFRVWVLDVLENLNKYHQPAIPETTTPSTADDRKPLRSPKKKALPLAPDSPQARINALLSKVDFYMGEIAEVEKRSAAILIEEHRQGRTGQRMSYDEGIYVSCTTRSLWSAIDFSLKAIKESIKAQLQP